MLSQIFLKEELTSNLNCIIMGLMKLWTDPLALAELHDMLRFQRAQKCCSDVLFDYGAVSRHW